MNGNSTVPARRYFPSRSSKNTHGRYVIVLFSDGNAIVSRLRRHEHGNGFTGVAVVLTDRVPEIAIETLKKVTCAGGGQRNIDAALVFGHTCCRYGVTIPVRFGSHGERGTLVDYHTKNKFIITGILWHDGT